MLWDHQSCSTTIHPVVGEILVQNKGQTDVPRANTVSMAKMWHIAAYCSFVPDNSTKPIEKHQENIPKSKIMWSDHNVSNYSDLILLPQLELFAVSVWKALSPWSFLSHWAGRRH